ncbi:YdaS family helix-turn-helix protein [Burkholderia gladioli]|uniref:YdaS family helix-turn-helix protein n=1 Tax=Burkholderia gladioli TaxID=28095 RepID=UPI00163FCCB5|nr:YdaS family helix-turn-helix protein [Burkholderia gladioli]
MEKLKRFLKALPINERDGFAARCGTTFAFLRNVAYGQRVAGEKLCVRIERESAYAVTRLDLRDDWQEIWPELIGADPPAPLAEPVATNAEGG